MSRRALGWLCFVTAGLLVVAELLGCAGIGNAPHLALTGDKTSPFLACALAGAFPLWLSLGRLSPKAGRAAWAVLLFALAVAIGTPLRLLDHDRLAAVLVLVSRTLSGFGVLGVAGLAVLSLGGDAAARGRAREALGTALLLPAFVVLSGFFLPITTILHPTTHDAFLFAFEEGLGWMPAVALSHAFAHLPALAAVCQAVYLALPLGFVALTVLLPRASSQERSPVLGFLAVGAVGYALYHLFPVIGPQDFFGKAFPDHLPAVGEVLGRADVKVASLAPRNCVPSLHTAWALIAFWYARPLHRLWRAAFGAALLLTVLATLGLGYHYFGDVVVAFPFTLAVLAACERRAVRRSPKVLELIAACAAAVLAWLLFFRFGARLSLASPLIGWSLGALTVGLCLLGERRLAGVGAATPSAPAVPTAPSTLSREGVGLAVAFLVSGFAGLAYEVVFAHSLSLIFGSTTRAAALVLAVFMGGIALGGWVGGRWAERTRSPLWGFAAAEAGVALWCAFSPLLIALCREAYYALGAGTDPASFTLVPLQALLAVLILLPPTCLMGTTLPLLARHISAQDETLGGAVGWLYALNTAGAAAGAILTGYLLLPTLGVLRTTVLAVALDLGAALLAYLLGRRRRAVPLQPPAIREAAAVRTREERMGMWVLGVGGLVTFALETVNIHFLAIAAGNSAYVFALMTFAFLVGLSSGAPTGRWLLRKPGSTLEKIAVLELLLGAVLLTCVVGWNAIPSVFAHFTGTLVQTDFPAQELVRALVCLGAMVPPAFLIGAVYPLAIDAAAGRNRAGAMIRLGQASAVNTLGNITGALLGGYLLIDLLGSVRSVQLLALLAGALGVACVLVSGQRRLLAPALLACGLCAVNLAKDRGLDLDALTTGANVYFYPQRWGKVVDASESVQGGLITVNALETPHGVVRTLLTNGKFQGDDGSDREMRAQLGFSLVPLLHTSARGRAAIIGLGTGVSARVAADAGFQHIDVAELSPDMARMAGRYFTRVNGGVLERPQVQVHLADGRNFLRLSNARYDLIGAEISSIWFAGAANLYNREYYEIVRSHLTERGVLQQWVQLHHLRRQDVLSVLASARAVFRHVWLYVVVNQGVLVGCDWDCAPTEETVATLAGTPALARGLGLVGGPQRLLEARLLGPSAFAKMGSPEREGGVDLDRYVSTDDNLRLEYDTPKGNARDYLASLEENLDFLRRFQPESPYVDTDLAPPVASQGAP